jgi:hypothetical protein
MYVTSRASASPSPTSNKALEFYHERLGWRLDADIKDGDVRVVQITPTGAGHVSIAFGHGVPTAIPGSMRHLEMVTSASSPPARNSSSLAST